MTIAACIAAAVAAGQAGEGDAHRKTLFGFRTADEEKRISVNADAAFELVEQDGGGGLRLTTGHEAEWPGITLKAPDGRWDLSSYRRVEVELRNIGKTDATICLRVDNPGADGREHCLTGRTEVQAGETRTLTVELTPTPFRLPPDVKLVGMRGNPAGTGKLDPANVTQLLIFAPRPKRDAAVVVGEIRAEGTVQPAPKKDFLPFIDKFGQYIHADWPGKLHALEEFPGRIDDEAEDIIAHPGPEGWSAWGGWADGPELEATGFFRPVEHEGRWWLVDPAGRLFWSHGPDCVRPNHAATPISDRESYFAWLPEKGDPLAAFYGKGRWAPHGYYKGKGTYRTFDFSGANLWRKWGKDWRERDAAHCHARLRSWGMNTIANWSDSFIYLKRKTPYVVSIHFGGPVMRGSKGFWRQFPDVFDPGFAESLRERMAREKDTTAGDPWCIGYFVGNELSWGREESLGTAALVSPPDQAANKALLAELREKYGTVEKLNAAWGSAYTSWKSLAGTTSPPAKPAKARDDMRAFARRAAETYFRICREEVKRVAPKNLYLGCRFAWVNDAAVRAAAKFCDVLSFNLYKYDVARFSLPKGVDMPVVIGEFHFGALDRGMFHTGLRPAEDQKDRAAKYRRYVRGALKNRLFVGAHWFQYGDQATTGRGDGENYQIGLVNVVDTPYPETIQAVRDVGYEMYRLRSGEK